jgi:hypothetical protein
LLVGTRVKDHLYEPVLGLRSLNQQVQECVAEFDALWAFERIDQLDLEYGFQSLGGAQVLQDH